MDCGRDFESTVASVVFTNTTFLSEAIISCHHGYVFSDGTLESTGSCIFNNDLQRVEWNFPPCEGKTIFKLICSNDGMLYTSILLCYFVKIYSLST